LLASPFPRKRTLLVEVAFTIAIPDCAAGRRNVQISIAVEIPHGGEFSI
jgi:hypothetical protein